MDFRIDLPLYRGPIDLLLYLIRKQEVPINEVELSKVIDQYGDYLEVLETLNLTEVGEFVDVASTMIEMKSQSVLPKIEEESEEPVAVEASGSELIEQLLKYKEIRDAASVLDEMGDRWQNRFTRLSNDLPNDRTSPADQPIVDLQLWDLVSAFGRIMREAGGPPQTEVVYDDTPIHVYMKAIHDRLRSEPKVPLVNLLSGGIHKSALIGWFLATLELTRHHGAAVEQDIHGDILVVKTDHYSEELSVAEVDNYTATQSEAAKMPGRPR